MDNDTDFSCFLPDEDATLALGARLATSVQAGMEGNLGAGKTTLSRGLLRGLGFSGRVKSPTYTLVEPYTVSNLYLYHFDLYRFNDASEWDDAGFRDHFNAQSICLIEWADKAEGLLPVPDWIITLSPEQDGRMARIQALSEQGRTCLNRFHL
jgi:tRNA threonylcarbamoyladenosine biosynthesis protein TsaE